MCICEVQGIVHLIVTQTTVTTTREVAPTGDGSGDMDFEKAPKVFGDEFYS